MTFNDNKPIYQQIADRLCDAILSGAHCPDERIPSVREYAMTVEVNANTIMRTYEMLQSQEIIYNKRGIGYFVSSDANEKILAMRRKTFFNNEIEYFFRQIQSLGINAGDLAKMYLDYCNNIKTTTKQ